MKKLNYISEERLNNFLEKIKALKSEVKLYISGYKDTKFNSARSVIEFLYGNGMSDMTKFASDDTNQRTGRARSIGDLYRICSFYIPDVKIKDVIDSAREARWDHTYDDDEYMTIYLSHVSCGDVNKIVYHYDYESYMDEIPDRDDFEEDIVFCEGNTYHLLTDLDL